MRANAPCVARTARRPAGVSATYRRDRRRVVVWIARARSQAALGFEPIERGVEGSAGHGTAGALFEQRSQRHGVRAVAEVQDAEQDGGLEFAEVGGVGFMSAMQAYYVWHCRQVK